MKSKHDFGGKSNISTHSDDGVQASWQRPFFLEITRTWIFIPIYVISRFLENQKDDQAIDKIQFSFGDLEGVIFTDSKALWHVIVKRNDAVENISIVENVNSGSIIKRNTTDVNTGSMVNRKSHELS